MIATERLAAPGRGRLHFLALVGVYAAMVAACLGTLAAAGDLSLGRQPWSNLLKSVAEFSRPSFVDVWFGEPQLEYRSDDGTVLRVDERVIGLAAGRVVFDCSQQGLEPGALAALYTPANPADARRGEAPTCHPAVGAPLTAG